MQNKGRTRLARKGAANNKHKSNMEKILEYVKEHGKGKYNLVRNDGTKVQLRLFISKDRDVCYKPRNVRGWGYPLRCYEYQSIDKVQPRKTPQEVARTRLRTIDKYLTSSGLWPMIHDYVRHCLSLNDEEFDKVFNQSFDERIVYNKEHGFTSTFIDGGIKSLCEPKSIKTVNYPWANSPIQEAVAKAIRERGDYNSGRWVRGHGYDNSVEVRLCEDGQLRGWYSKQRRNCGNGHYYLLLDEKHALFCEDD